jgi:hypothetical protein
MGVWSPAFQHQFLDGNLLNFSAAPGSEPDISFEAPVVRPSPPPGQRGFPVRRGNRFDYRFVPGLFGSIIGADIKLDIAFPPGSGTAQTLGNVTLANGAIRLLLGFVSGSARIQLFVNGDVMNANARFDPDSPLRIQTRWHTHGQGQIWINGSLRSHDPALAPGMNFTIEQLAFGHHDTSTIAPSAPAFLIRRICVKLLRDIDALRCLDGLFPIAEPIPLGADCRRKLADVEHAVLGEIRAFMQQSIVRLTSTWRDGMSGGPFTPEAVAAHAAAIAAGRAFVQFMLRHPGGDPDLIKQKLEEFLVLIRAADPVAYDQAIARLRAISQPYDAHCLAQLQPLVQVYGARLQPVVDLLEALWTTMQSPGGTP